MILYNKRMPINWGHRAGIVADTRRAARENKLEEYDSTWSRALTT